VVRTQAKRERLKQRGREFEKERLEQEGRSFHYTVNSSFGVNVGQLYTPKAHQLRESMRTMIETCGTLTWQSNMAVTHDPGYEF
jgi:hypothetical protein